MDELFEKIQKLIAEKLDLQSDFPILTNAIQCDLPECQIIFPCVLDFRNEHGYFV